jgi:hypothetical protein
VRLGGVTFANVHLSHGQFLNRWQLFHIANAVDGPTAIVGDYNAVGPITLPGFEDIGPRQPTHSPTNVISLRLDRCMARGMGCSHAQVLARGPSDHHPIILNLHLLTAATAGNAGSLHPAGRSSARSIFGTWLPNVAQAPDGIRVRHVLRHAIDRKLRRRTLAAVCSQLSADVTHSRSQPQGLNDSAGLDVG